MSENTSPDASPDASPELIERYRQRARELRENAIRVEDELRAVEEKKAELQITLARIRGAVQVLEEIIDELTKRGGTGAMCAASFKKHFPDQVHDHQHFPDR